jgi:hypothetical protein
VVFQGLFVSFSNLRSTGTGPARGRWGRYRSNAKVIVESLLRPASRRFGYKNPVSNLSRDSCLVHFEFEAFEFVSDLGFRYSDFRTDAPYNSAR